MDFVVKMQYTEQLSQSISYAQEFLISLNFKRVACLFQSDDLVTEVIHGFSTSITVGTITTLNA